MPRYFIELTYKGTVFSGFQIQNNAFTIQGEINKALRTVLHEDIQTTTASRTDAGVHASQNFLHFDFSGILTSKMIYNLNSIISDDILIQNIFLVSDISHSRFDAISREYDYFINSIRNPFIKETSYFYPVNLDIEKLNQAAGLLQATTDFSSFAKRHSDVNNFNCNIDKIGWTINSNQQLVFNVVSNRFLRGMVRALVATQLLVGRNKISLNDFENVIKSKDCTNADFSAPAKGLFLQKVNYPKSLLMETIAHSY